MNRQKPRGKTQAASPSPFDQARDEMFQHVMRCGVIGSESEHMREWFDETMIYLSARYHELDKKAIADLRVLGERFAAPTKPRAPVAPLPPIDAGSDEAEEGQLDTVSAA